MGVPMRQKVKNTITTETINRESAMSNESTTTTTTTTYESLGEFRKVMSLIGHAVSSRFELGETQNPCFFYVRLGGTTFCLNIADAYEAAGNNLSILLDATAMSLGTDGEIMVMDNEGNCDGRLALTMAEALQGAADVIDLPTTEHAHTVKALRTATVA